MTLFEMLLVLAILALVIGLTLSFRFPSEDAEGKADGARRDFSSWYQHIRARALYESMPQRICLEARRAKIENYAPQSGWRETATFYLPPPGLDMHWKGDTCSGVINDSQEDFSQRVSFVYDD